MDASSAKKAAPPVERTCAKCGKRGEGSVVSSGGELAACESLALASCSCAMQFESTTTPSRLYNVSIAN